MPPRQRKTLGAALQAAREEKELSVRALARLVDVHPSTILRFEADEARPKQDLLTRLARALGVKVGELAAFNKGALPDLAPYLRARYALSDEAVAELEAAFAEVTGRSDAGPRRPAEATRQRLLEAAFADVTKGRQPRGGRS